MSAGSNSNIQQVPAELVDFFEGGVSILVATSDEALHPEGVRAVGATVSEDRAHLTVYLNRATAGRTIANLALNSRIAICFARPIDHRSVQVKGRVTKTRPARSDEKGKVERYMSSFVEALYMVGITRAAAARVGHWPSVVVEVEIENLFHQTPGPGAGRTLS